MGFDLAVQLENIVQALDAAGVEYALCGGLAMAVYGVPRATVDIDLLIEASDADSAIESARQLGFTLPADLMVFANGDIRIRRISKIDPDTGDPISLDLLLVTPPIRPVWQCRRKVQWQAGELWVVSRKGLIELKRIRSSAQDLADIARLQDQTDD